MAATTLSFADHDGVTGAPTLDGLSEYDILPFNPLDPIEAGYVNGSKITFDGGALPRVVFHGVRVPGGGDRLFLAFMARFDTEFDADDMVVIALRGSHAAAGQSRYIKILPNLAGVGADSSPVDPMANPFFIKRNVTPQPSQVNVYKNANSGSTWTEYAETGVQVRTRSWHPAPTERAWSVEVSIPRTAGGGSDWIDLNDSFGLYWNVVRINGVGAVQAPFPSNAGDLLDEPTTTFAVPAWGQAFVPALQMPAGSNTGLGVSFRNGWQGIGRRDKGSATTVLTDLIATATSTTPNTDNELVALVQNTSSDVAADLTAEFRIANWGLPPATFPAWDKPLGLIPNPAPDSSAPAPYNAAVTLAAGTVGSPTTGEIKTPWNKASVPPEYTTKNHQCIFVELGSPHEVNFTQASMRRNMNFATLSEVEREAEVSGVGYPPPPDGADDHDFVLESFHRPISVGKVVKAGEVPDELGALIGATVQAAGKAGAKMVKVGESTAVSTGNQTQWDNVVVHAWITFGYRRTGKFMTIRGNKYEILDDGPGAFGVSAFHEGVDDNFSFALSGPGLVQYKPGIYGLKVPHKGTTRIKIRLETNKEGPSGDRSDLPKALFPHSSGTGPGTDHGGGTRPGCLAALFGIFRSK